MYRFAVAIILASVGLAQDAPDSDLVRAAKSPYALARYIDSHMGFAWEPLWKTLGIEERIFIQPCGELSGGALGCSTEIIDIQNPDQVILIVQGDMPVYDVYLRFEKGSKGDWDFAGEYGVNIRNHPRRHEITRVRGTPFLRVSRQGVYGSGVDSEIEDWIDLTQPDFNPVFSFTVQGHDSEYASGIGREIYTIASPTRTGIDLILDVVFSGPDVDLGHAEYVGTYTRSRGPKFSLQTVRTSDGSPTISNKDFENLSEIDSDLTEEQLLVYTLPRLKEIASGQDKDAKDWLKGILDHCKDTPEKRTLLDLLSKH
ncbi:MAG TPA: hypothetical protein VHZ07_26070 [Bryobacteraceae bacterium]|jgi:hypothetical protein|nr:hypothetical protein [Bryobacteraceae bacterium]